MKKHLLLFALFLTASQLAFSQEVNLSGTVLCPDGTQFNSGGINYIFMTQDSTLCCVDSVGIPLDSNGAFDYTFTGDSQGVVTLWYANADGMYVGASAVYNPENTELTFVLNACAEEEEPCMVDISFAGDSIVDELAYIYLNAYSNIVNPTYSWTFGDGGTSSEANPVYDYNQTGTYTICVTVTGSGCTATDCIEIAVDPEGNGEEGGGMMVQGFTLIVNGMVTATSELSIHEISVYPNPIASGQSLFIETPFAFKGEISLYSISGSLIESYTSTLGSGKNSLPINTKNLIPGVYVLQIRDNTNKVHQFKLIY